MDATSNSIFNLQIRPNNLLEKIVFSAINPRSSETDRKLNRIVLIALCIVFSFVTLGLGIILCKKIALTYANFRNHIDRKISELAQPFLQKNRLLYLHHKKTDLVTLETALEKWVKKETGERRNIRKIVKNEIIICFKFDIEVINLSSMNLTELPNEIRFLQKSLKRINISGNDFRAFPPQLFQLKNLTEINFSRNSLREFPIRIQELPQLRSLDLSQNYLQNIPRLLELQNLTISISDNPLLEPFLRSYYDPFNNRVMYQNNLFIFGIPRLREQPQVNQPLESLDNDINVPLSEMINFWKAYALKTLDQQNIKFLETHPQVRFLTKFLDRLKKNQDFILGTTAQKQIFSERVIDVLKNMSQIRQFANNVFQLLIDVQSDCQDRAELKLNSIERFWMINFQTHTTLDLANLCIGFHCLDQIEILVQKYPPGIDRVELELELQLELIKVIKLPIKTRTIKYSAGLSLFLLKSMTNKIYKSLEEENAILIILLNSKAWKDELRKGREEFYSKLVETVPYVPHSKNKEKENVAANIKIGTTNEILENQYRKDTLKWLNTNLTELMSSLFPPIEKPIERPVIEALRPL